VVGGVIELDVTVPWEPPERSRVRRPVQRGLAVFAVLAAVLGVAGASQRPARYGTTFTIEGGNYVNTRNDGHTLYVLRQADPNASIVDAYRLADGHRIWSQRRGRVNMLIDIGSGMLLLHAPEPGAQADDPSVIVALDIRDGHEIWRRSDYAPFSYTVAGGVLVVVPYLPANIEDPYQQERRSRKLVGLDARTGADVWSRVTPPGTIRSYLDERDESGGFTHAVGELDPDGTLRMLDAATGAVARTAHVRGVGPIDGFDVSGRLMTTFQSGQYGPQAVSVFDLATGEKLWAEPPSRQSEPLSWCGPVLCSDDGTGTVVVNPRTGGTLWQTPPRRQAWPLDDTHMVTTDASPSTGGWPTQSAVHDLRTGAVLRQLGGWMIMDSTLWPKLVVLGRDGPDGGLAGVMDAGTGYVTVFGRLSKVYAEPSCGVEDGYFLCQTGAGLTAFRIPT
jgi:outer membrane protein assembly factor BamB